MVARGMHGCQGGMHGCQGECMVGGHSWLQGAWVVARGYAWLPQCVRGCGGHMWLCGVMSGGWGGHAWDMMRYGQ